MDVGGIELKGSKVHDFVLANIFDHRTAEVIGHEFPFSDICWRNSLGCYQYSIYYDLNSVLNTIVIFQTHMNYLPFADRELDN